MSYHATAVIHAATRLHPEVTVGPYAVIEDGVEIGEGTLIREHAIIRSGTQIGRGCVIDAHAVIGGLPQDIHFHPSTPTGVMIGNNVVIREGVTISRAVDDGAITRVGDDCFLMANCHVGHDCRLGSHVILANGVLLAGRVRVDDHVFIGGGAAVHQFCRIGEGAMVGGLARVSQDLAPFCLMAERNALSGLNLIGLRRRGFAKEEISEIKKLYHLIFGVEGRPAVLAEAALRDGLAKTGPGLGFLKFLIAESRKGLMRPTRNSEGEGCP